MPRWARDMKSTNAGVVHGRDRIEPEVGGIDDRDARAAQLVVQRVAALRFLVARFSDAEPVAAVGRVPTMTRGPDSGHRSDAIGRKLLTDVGTRMPA